MVVEIFIPCYYGSEILAVSVEVSASLFDSDWIDEGKNFKTAMKIFMEKTKRLNKISIFGVYDVDLETFTIICKSAFSLYAVFKSVSA